MRIDNEYYDDLGDLWWDDRGGPLRVLHEMNPVRVGYIDGVLSTALAAPRREDVRVLDVGCGGGILSEALARLGYRVTGIDRAAGAVEAARRHAAAGGLTINYAVGSAYALDIPDAGVDAAVICDVLEHLEDLPRAVSELARVVRPGGVVVFDTINRTARSYLVLILLAQRIFRIAHPHTHDWRMFIRPDELRATFAQHGLDLREVTGLVPAPPRPRVALNVLRTGLTGGFTTGTDLSISYLGHALNPVRKPARPPAAGPDGSGL